MADPLITTSEIDGVLAKVYEWSRRQGYFGYNKHDGLNSPLLHAALGWSKWARIMAIQGVMRFPINIRPSLFVKRTRNPKGLALFVVGLLDQYRATGNNGHLAEAEMLLELLLSLRSPGNWSGDCWGYPYPWQDMGFYAPTHTPNAVVTCFVAQAFLDAYQETRQQHYLDVVDRATKFLLNDLTVLKDTDKELCMAYMPLPMQMRVMDVSILIGTLLAQYAAVSGDTSHKHKWQRLLNYVVGQQTEYGAWFYTDPPGDSPIQHDNYHTGFILDALWNYMQATGDSRWIEIYNKGLHFYANELFNPDGSPRWMSDRDYPHDIHGAAQGIITFARHRSEYPDLASCIARWALDTMHHPEGRFYYQEGRFWKKRFTLLRWCNAWMARALAHLRLTLS